MLADDLEFACIVQVQGAVLAAGYNGDEGKAYFEWSDDRGQTKHEFNDGSTRKEIAASDAQQPAIEMLLPTADILVSLVNGGVLRSYVSQDWGETWTYLDALT